MDKTIEIQDESSDKTIQIQNESLDKTIEVLTLQFENPHRTITGLCAEVRLPRYQFYRYLKEGTHIIQVLRKLIIQSKRVELATIASSRHRILENLVDRALDSTIVDDLIKTLVYLDVHEKELENDLGAKPGLEDEARDFLKQGPSISKQESKFASIRVTPEEDGSVVMDFLKEQDIIEIDAEDVTP